MLFDGVFCREARRLVVVAFLEPAGHVQGAVREDAVGTRALEMPSAPARLKEIIVSMVIFFSSMQPMAAAHLIMAYSPET